MEIAVKHTVQAKAKLFAHTANDEFRDTYNLVPL